ncbi:MAG: aminodeoxychorismate synthase component I [Acidimicrobiia bacterium]|nr:aminodeoxychorismate synthase component I [Acidimicrobiia bacterium]
MSVSARFDDLVSGRSFRLDTPAATWTAGSLDDVSGALRRVEHEARAGRWVAGFVSYEAAPGLDPALRTRQSDPDLPLAWFAAFEEHVDVPAPPRVDAADVTWTADVDAEHHAAAVADVRERIAAGITYQVNLTHRLTGNVADPASLYAAMLHGQRPAYGALLDTGDHVVASASPELFFDLDGDALTTRPMKGTIGRGRWSAEDEARREDLAGSEKDRAENLMIVDLLRNDLGRIARFGTVRVDDLFAIERYETVWQMTSTISARARADVGLVDVFTALFPCGSVTGAPKSSTMAIIAELEDRPRGVYCGAVGVVEPGMGRAVFSVPIRTVVVDREGDAVYGTGGGITWDSSATGEWDEAEVKARVLVARRPAFALLETLRLDASGYHALGDHLDRLAASARYFGRTVDLDAVRHALAAVEAEPPVVVRLTVDADGAIGVAPRPLPEADGPVRLAVDPEPIDRHDPFRFHKTTHRTMYEEASKRFPEADDVVAVDERGQAVETTIGNLVVLVDGEWRTPPLDAGCLPGIERARLLRAGDVVEAPVTVDDLRRAEAIEVVNSVRGRRAAVLVD